MTGKTYSSFLDITILIVNVANLLHFLKSKEIACYIISLQLLQYKPIDIYRDGSVKKIKSGSDIKVLHLLIGLPCRHNYMASL